MYYFSDKYFGNTYLTVSYFGLEGNSQSMAYTALYYDGQLDFAPYFQSDYWSLTNYASGPEFTILSYSPGSGSTVGINTIPYVALSQSPLNGSVSFVLRDSGNAVVPASLSYNYSNNESILTPTHLLAYSAPYFYSFSASGVNGIKVQLNNIPFTTAASSLPVHHHHIIKQIPGRLFNPTRNLVIDTYNVTQIIVKY